MEQQDAKNGDITPENNPVAYTLSVTTPDEVVAVVNNPEIKPHARPTYELTRNVFFVGFMVAVSYTHLNAAGIDDALEAARKMLL